MLEVGVQKQEEKYSWAKGMKKDLFEFTLQL